MRPAVWEVEGMVKQRQFEGYVHRWAVDSMPRGHLPSTCTVIPSPRNGNVPFLKKTKHMGGLRKEKLRTVKCSNTGWAQSLLGTSRRAWLLGARRNSRGRAPQLRAMVCGRPAEMVSVQSRDQVSAPTAPCHQRLLAVPSCGLPKVPIAEPGERKPKDPGVLMVLQHILGEGEHLLLQSRKESSCLFSLLSSLKELFL